MRNIVWSCPYRSSNYFLQMTKVTFGNQFHVSWLTHINCEKIPFRKGEFSILLWKSLWFLAYSMSSSVYSLSPTTDWQSLSLLLEISLFWSRWKLMSPVTFMKCRELYLEMQTKIIFLLFGDLITNKFFDSNFKF